MPLLGISEVHWSAVTGRFANAIAAFLIVLVASTLLATLSAMLIVCLELIWTDLLHVNPYRPASNVLTMMLLSPLYGGAIAVSIGGSSILLGAFLSAVIVLLSGRLPLAAITGVAVVCAVFFVHSCYVGAEENATEMDWRLSSPPWTTLIGGVCLLTASLLGGQRAFCTVVGRRTTPAS